MLTRDEIPCGFPLGHAEIQKPHDCAFNTRRVVLIIALRQNRDVLRLQHGVRLPGGHAHEFSLLSRGACQIPVAGIGQIADGKHRRQMAGEVRLHIRLPVELVAGSAKQVCHL